MWRFICMFLLLLAMTPAIYAQQADTTSQESSVLSSDTIAQNSSHQTADKDDDDFLVFLFFIAIAFFLLCLVCVGVGIVVAVSGCLLFIAFVSLGIVSASFVAGLRRKSFSSGFRVFLVLCSIVAGVAISIAGAFLLDHFFHYNLSRDFLFTLGAVSGVVAGFVLGQFVFIMFRKGLDYAKAKLRLR